MDKHLLWMARSDVIAREWHLTSDQLRQFTSFKYKQKIRIDATQAHMAKMQKFLCILQFMNNITIHTARYRIYEVRKWNKQKSLHYNFIFSPGAFENWFYLLSRARYGILQQTKYGTYLGWVFTGEFVDFVCNYHHTKKEINSILTYLPTDIANLVHSYTTSGLMCWDNIGIHYNP
jgi:hypothetical protein